MDRYDYTIIGSGIVGVSVAYHLKLTQPRAKVILLEKEPVPFLHQTSHNSGVIHAGVYYKPGSLKSKFCIEGLQSTYEFCNQNQIKYFKCGKLIAATNKEEQLRLHALYENSDKNGLSLKLLSKTQIFKKEPNLNSVEALYSPNTGIIDWADFGKCMFEKFRCLGGEVRLGYKVETIEENDSSVNINSNFSRRIETKKLISCGGLQSDRIARMVGLVPQIKIIPFRGDYFLLDKKYNNLFNHLIYPVPNPKMPFLGIHFTKMIDGSMTLGPNASVNFSREDYQRYKLNFNDLKDYLFYGGFWKLIFNHKEFIAKEFLTSFSRFYYLKQCTRYYSGLSLNDIYPFRAGIRAQAVAIDGKPIHDFLFESTDRCLFVLNAPSPAATSSIPIGKYIVQNALANI
jgi:L-2-hydroxyglutarate oxidase